MRFNSIPTTSTFAWSPSSLSLSLPLLATGTVAGALDENFSNDAVLEIWSPFDKYTESVGKITSGSKFNRLAWGNPSHTKGLIAAGMESGELAVYDAQKIIDGEEYTIFQNSQHSGPVRGVDFNKIRRNLLVSGAVNGELYIWDLNNPTKPFSPGPKNRALEEITSVSWNPQVPHILASASNSGFTVIWDSKSSREAVAPLMYNGAALGGGAQQGWMGGQSKRGVSQVQWSPDNPTRLITACEDDSMPIIMIWDLRNSRAPEKILQGHEKGILSLAWCERDPELLLSCGKDCRTICWNPSSGEIVGELPPSNNWSFQVDWCPRNPDLLAVASYDGRIDIHSLQSTNKDETTVPTQESLPSSAGASAFFDSAIQANASHAPSITLKQPPKWLKRPASVSWGFGGKLVSVTNNQVQLQTVVTEGSIVEEAVKLDAAAVEGPGGLRSFCEEKTDQNVEMDEELKSAWKLLSTLFQANRDELVTLLGFSKEEIESKVESAIKAFKSSTGTRTPGMTRSKSSGVVSTSSEVEESINDDLPIREPQVTFSTEEPTPAVSISSAVSDTGIEPETEVTEPSLFGDDAQAGNAGAASDFFNNLGGNRPTGIPLHVLSDRAEVISNAATAGSRPESVTSDSLKQTTFNIYPTEESEADRLITRALVLGDFDSAVSLCLSTERFADAILLAVRGGSDLLAKTQKAYFEKRTTDLPYLRLYQSIVLDDLTDVVQNADLTEWQEIFVVLCTFAKKEEFPSLAKQLGQRLEFQCSEIRRQTSTEEDRIKANTSRKNAMLCYLAAGKLDKAIGIWSEEMQEEEVAISGQSGKDGVKEISPYTAHARALQTFIEKVTIFQSAVNYVDQDLEHPTQSAVVADSGARTYKLATLYDRYIEYAEILAAQGLVTTAWKYVSKTPSDYHSAGVSESVRARLERNGGKVTPSTPKATTKSASTLTSFSAPKANSYDPPSNVFQNSYAPPVVTGPYGVVDNPYGIPSQPSFQPLTAPYDASNPYAAPVQQQQTPYNPYATNTAGGSSFLPAPPTMIGTTPVAGEHPNKTNVPPPPSSNKPKEAGWNDAPELNIKRTITPAAPKKTAPINSPFPNAPSGQIPPQGPYNPHAASGVPPPPRGSTPQSFPPPPMGQRPPSRPQTLSPPPQHFGPNQVGNRNPNVPAGPGPFRGPPGPPHMLPGQPGYPNQPIVPPQFQQGPQSQFNGSHPPQFQRPQFQAQTQFQPGPPPGAQHPQFPPGPPQHVNGNYGPPAPGRIASPPQPTQISQPQQQSAPPPPKPEPPKSKYPPGDRTHIPEESKPIVGYLSQALQRLRQVVPPQQKRIADDTERRINILFDHLNCATISKSVIQRLHAIIGAMQAHDGQRALQIHLELLTHEHNPTDDIGTWQSAVKLLIQRAL